MFSNNMYTELVLTNISGGGGGGGGRRGGGREKWFNFFLLCKFYFESHKPISK